jgi:hypothetical protein
MQHACAQQPNLSSSMQSIESAIVLKAMQRISSLFQQEQVPNSGGIDVLIANAAMNKVAGQPGWFPGSGGRSAFVPQSEGQGAPAVANAANAPAAPSQRLSPVAEGAFCGDSDVMGDAQKVCNLAPTLALRSATPPSLVCGARFSLSAVHRIVYEYKRGIS